jgi:uncharacterized protein
MKINVNKIPLEGLTLEEGVAPSKLDLDTEIVKFRDPIKITAQVLRITNALTVDLILNYSLYMSCSRCLNEFKAEFKKNLQLNYSVSNLEPVIDLNPDIRYEIILGYPMRALCRLDCKGLCLRCGKNLNEGECNCK